MKEKFANALIATVVVAVLGVVFGAAYFDAKAARHSQRVCLENGYPKFYMVSGEWWCERRVLGTDEVVSASSLE